MGRKKSAGKTEMRASTDLGFLSPKESHGKPQESFKQEATESHRKALNREPRKATGELNRKPA